MPTTETPRLYEIITLRKKGRKSNFAPVRTQYIHTYGQLRTRIQSSPTDIQTPTHRNLIGRSMSAPPPMLSLISTLLPVPSHCDSTPPWEKKLGAH